MEMDKTHSLPRAQQGKMTYEPTNRNKERYVDVEHTVGHLKRLWLNTGGSVHLLEEVTFELGFEG